MPFYFLLSPDGSSYRLRGEGTGDKTLTDAAARELTALTAENIAALIGETRKTTTPGTQPSPRQEHH
jgi:hypothetical protein